MSPLGTIWSYFVPKVRVPMSTYVVTRIFFHFHLLQKGHFSKIHISAPGGVGPKFFWAFNQVWIGVQNECLTKILILKFAASLLVSERVRLLSHKIAEQRYFIWFQLVAHIIHYNAYVHAILIFALP